jgi:hypothetical protein
MLAQRCCREIWQTWVWDQILKSNASEISGTSSDIVLSSRPESLVNFDRCGTYSAYSPLFPLEKPAYDVVPIRSFQSVVYSLFDSTSEATWSRHLENQRIFAAIGAEGYRSSCEMLKRIQTEPLLVSIVKTLLDDLQGPDVFWDGEIEDDPVVASSDDESPFVRLERRTKIDSPGFGALSVVLFPFSATLTLDGRDDIVMFCLHDQFTVAMESKTSQKKYYRLKRDCEDGLRQIQHLIEINQRPDVVKMREHRMRIRSLNGKALKLKNRRGSIEVQQQPERGSFVESESHIPVCFSSGFDCYFVPSRSWFNKFACISTTVSSPVEVLQVDFVQALEGRSEQESSLIEKLSSMAEDGKVDDFNFAFQETRMLLSSTQRVKDLILPFSFQIDLYENVNADPEHISGLIRDLHNHESLSKRIAKFERGIVELSKAVDL